MIFDPRLVRWEDFTYYVATGTEGGVTCLWIHINNYCIGRVVEVRPSGTSINDVSCRIRMNVIRGERRLLWSTLSPICGTLEQVPACMAGQWHTLQASYIQSNMQIVGLLSIKPDSSRFPEALQRIRMQPNISAVPAEEEV